MQILVSSGYADACALDLLAGAPVSGFLQKPYAASVLADRIEPALAPTSSPRGAELPWRALRAPPEVQREASQRAMRDISNAMRQSWNRAPPQP